jgi:hypothetical protein
MPNIHFFNFSTTLVSLQAALSKALVQIRDVSEEFSVNEL